jgi:hypothetical protein
MSRGTLRRATRVGEASKVKGRFWGGTRRKFSRAFAKSLLGEEPEKQRAAAPQDDGKTPSACPTRDGQTRSSKNTRPAGESTGSQGNCRAKEDMATLSHNGAVSPKEEDGLKTLP